MHRVMPPPQVCPPSQVNPGHDRNCGGNAHHNCRSSRGDDDRRRAQSTAGSTGPHGLGGLWVSAGDVVR